MLDHILLLIKNIVLVHIDINTLTVVYFDFKYICQRVLCA